MPGRPDSGLAGWFVSAKDVTASLLRRHVITPTTFKGLTVEFMGLGTTAAPQTKLPASQVTALTAIYSAIVRAGGGTPVVTPTAWSGAPIQVCDPAKDARR